MTNHLFVRTSLAVGPNLEEIESQEPSFFNIDAENSDATFKSLVDNAAWVIAMAQTNGDVDQAAVVAEDLKRTYCGE